MKGWCVKIPFSLVSLLKKEWNFTFTLYYLANYLYIKPVFPFDICGTDPARLMSWQVFFSKHTHLWGGPGLFLTNLSESCWSSNLMNFFFSILKNLSCSNTHSILFYHKHLQFTRFCGRQLNSFIIPFLFKTYHWTGKLKELAGNQDMWDGRKEESATVGLVLHEESSVQSAGVPLNWSRM